MPRITTSFGRYKDAELEQRAQVVLNSLNNNPAYPTPTPQLMDLQTALNAFRQAMAEAENGGKLSVATKNQTRDALENVLNQLALYVQLTGKSDEVVLVSSGFELSKPRTSVGVLPKPENFKVEPGAARGSVKLSTKSIKGADSYVFEYTPFPATADSVWTNVITSKAGLIIDGLSSGRQYVFRVVGVGADPTRVYSDELSSFVL